MNGKSEVSSTQQFDTPRLEINDKDGIQTLIDEAKKCLEELDEARLTFINKFKQELMYKKTQGVNSQITIDDNNKMYFDANRDNSNNHNNSAFLPYPYSYKEVTNHYNSAIRFSFKNAKSKLYFLIKTAEYAIKFSGCLVVPGDVLNLLNYFDKSKKDSVNNLESYMKKTINEFFRRYKD